MPIAAWTTVGSSLEHSSDSVASPYLQTHRFHILSEILVVTIILHVSDWNFPPDMRSGHGSCEG